MLPNCSTSNRQYLRSHAAIEDWGKVRRIDSDEGDTIHSASMITMGDDSRDCTYVRGNNVE